MNARRVGSFGALAALLAVSACGGDDTTTGSGGGGGSGGSSACGEGALATADGCVPIGIEGCDPRFVDDDAVCRPATSKCPPGSIPQFDKGCAPVGIQDCAEIFRGDDGLCHPTMAKCKDDEFAVPSLGCVPIDGAGCGSGTWGDIEDEPGTSYVDASYGGGDSDGSRSKPYLSVADAIHLGEATRIAVAAGTYSDFILSPRDVEIVGRCASMVTLDGSDHDPNQPVNVGASATGLTLRNVRLTGDAVGVYAEESAVVTIDGVFFDSTRTSAIAAFDPTKITVSNSFISRTRPSPAGEFGVAGQAATGASISFVHTALFENVDGGGVGVGADSAIILQDTLVEGTLARESDGLQGAAVAVQHGAIARLTSSAIVGATATGIQCRGATVIADQVIIDATRPQKSDQGLGVGIDLDQASNLDLTSSVVSRSRSAGIYANDAQTRVKLDRVLIADTLEAADSRKYGFGISLGFGAVGTFTDVTLARNHEVGLLISDTGTSVTASGLLVEATAKQVLDGEFGVGITVVSGAALDLQRSAVIGGTVAGLLAATARVTVASTLLSGIAGGDVTLLSPVRHFKGVGDGILAVEQPSVVDVGKTRIEGCARAGFLFSDAAGSIALSRATQNVYGLVIDGSQKPKVDGDTSLEDNEHPKVDDASLPVPSAPAPPPR